MSVDMMSDERGWLGVVVSSAVCIIGALIVFIDKFFHKSILDSRAFMSSSMALASGVLLFSSLAILLPQAQKRLDNNALLYTFFFAGATFTALITRFIHYLMPDAIHACGDDPHHHHEGEQQKLNTGHHHHADVEYGTISSNEVHFRFHHDDQELGTDQHHHHHHEPAKETLQHGSGNYYSIGIQTAIAICVHKFPEGLVMFVSSKASTALGLSVCIAMSIHNLTEGFMIALPLYYATRSRTKAFISAAVMGGLSQPFGALIGLFLLEHISKNSENLLFGVVFACVSGMMSLITIQSMLPQAIRADSHKSYVGLFFFLGIFLVGLSSILETF